MEQQVVFEKYAVYYQRSFGCHLGGPSVTYEDVLQQRTHQMVKFVDVERIEDVFVHMQAEHWNSDGNASDMLRRMGLKHTSMSVGDCAFRLSDKKLFWCGAFGWKEIESNISGSKASGSAL